MNYAVRERLRLIDFLLKHYGSVSRAEIEDYFGIGPATATRDFQLYTKANPGNALLNPTSKRYVRAETFKSAFSGEPQS